MFIIRTVEADLLALWMNFMSVLKEFDVCMQMSSHHLLVLNIVRIMFNLKPLKNFTN